jgi:hypothetical protein
MPSYYFLRLLCLLFLTYITVEQVARTKSTARHMTTEELAAAGLPVDPEVQDPETAQLPEGHSSPATSGSRSHEDGEVSSDDEDVGDVDADVKDLISQTVKASSSVSCFRRVQSYNQHDQRLRGCWIFSRGYWTCSTKRTDSYS